MADPEVPQSAAERLLAERYGHRAPSRAGRGLWLVAVAVPIFATLCWWLWVAVDHSTPDLTWQLVGFDAETDSSVEVNWLVDRDARSPVDCVLRARDAAGEEVGRDRVPVPTGGGERVDMTWTLRTSSRPVTGEVLGCVEVTG